MKPEIKTILYATDMGDHMGPVFRYAVEMARRFDAKIIMLHAAEPLSSGVLLAIDIYMSGTSAQELIEDGMKKSLQEMKQRLKRFCADELNNDPEDRELISKVKVVSGKSAETITHQAELLEADLIVVGTHTDPSVTAHLLGSTARRVTQLAKIPVLVVPVHK
jgi:nucleotide-binding universal stress UspA family protein